VARLMASIDASAKSARPSLRRRTTEGKIL
jgi:hypothetical protein